LAGISLPGRRQRGVMRFIQTLAFVCIFSCTIGTWAQSAQVSGVVIDTSRAAVSGASVEILNTDTKAVWRSRSNGEGVYSAPSLVPGHYKITVSADRFQNTVAENLELQVAQKLSLELVLRPGSVAQTVVVDASGIEINTTDAGVSAVIDRQFVDNIPLNGRSFQSLMTIIPGVNVVPNTNGVGAGGEISVNGQRTESNYFMIDGLSANTGVSPTASGTAGGYGGNTPGESTLGTTQTLVSLEALQEFRTSTSTYSAEYGRSPGGQFSFNTRSGTNEYHGNIYDYFRNDALDANQWFNGYTNSPALGKPAERQNDFGGMFGGPVTIPHLYRGGDKSFVFFSYEGLRLRSPQSATNSLVPNTWLRENATGFMNTIVSAFPTPTSGDNGSRSNGLAYSSRTYSNPSNLDSSSLRLDQNFGDRHRAFLRLSRVPNDTTSRSSSNLAVTNKSYGTVKSAALGLTSLVAQRLTNEARFGLTGNDTGVGMASTDFGGATPFAISSVPGIGALPNVNWLYVWLGIDSTATASGIASPTVTLSPMAIKQRQINAVDWMSTTIGQHTLKWGVDYRRTVTSQFLPPDIEYGYFYSIDEVLTSVPRLTYIYKFASNAKPAYNNYSLYLQDEWKTSPHLSISAGLRWDINPAPKDLNGNNPYTVTSTDLSTLTIAPQGTDLWKTRWNNIAPRVGLAYQLRQGSGNSTVLRAGAGLFHDTGNTLGSRGYNGAGIFGLSVLSSHSFPLTSGELNAVPGPNASTPYQNGFYGFDPNLKTPYTIQWSAAVEQSLGTMQTVTVRYVGSVSHDLLWAGYYYPRAIGNTAFSASAGLFLTTNAAGANYHSLQAQWQRKVSRGLQVLASYTLAHALDDSSSNFPTYIKLYGNSNYDIRHNFQAAATYDFPTPQFNRVAKTILGSWSVDARVSTRSALPVDVVGGSVANTSTGSFYYYHPNRVSGVPLYTSTPATSPAAFAGVRPPGGRRINPAAFTVVTNSTGTPIEGNAGRNIARGFSAAQADISLRREFHFTEASGLEFRAEAFNVLNHPILGSIYSQLSSTSLPFGYAYTTQNTQLGGLNSLYQQGGPRSIQIALKVHF